MIVLGAGPAREGQMTLVQRAHGGDKAKRPLKTAPPGAYIRDRRQYLHRCRYRESAVSVTSAQPTNRRDRPR